MRRSLALPSAGIAFLALAAAIAPASAKPCAGWAGIPALEEMLPRARTALDIAGTEQVALDPSTRCIGIQVHSRGTARLVKLLLRGMDVPGEAVELRVVERGPVRGA